jgi:hypothetical protein
LFDDVGYGVGDGGLEGDSAGIDAGEVYANELAWLEGWFHDRILALRAVECKESPLEQE